MSARYDLMRRLWAAEAELGGIRVRSALDVGPLAFRVTPNRILAQREAPIAYALAGLWPDGHALLRAIRRHIAEAC